MENNTGFVEGERVAHKEDLKNAMRVEAIIGDRVYCSFKNSKGDWVKEDFFYGNLVKIEEKEIGDKD